MDIIIYILLSLIAILIAVILIRTALFKPKANAKVSDEVISFDGDKAVENLRELVRCKTVSYRDSSLEDDGEFKKLIAKLPELYPNVFKACDFKELPDRALLFKWEGKNHNEPTVLMAHYDVVPVDEKGWDKPPFEAILEDGVIWGRGTLDTKATVNGVLYSADCLIADGFVPENDIYFAFGGDEEINGHGAVAIVELFEKRGITPGIVVDEGEGERDVQLVGIVALAEQGE
jgi:carboxypeptidase PM20D1